MTSRNHYFKAFQRPYKAQIRFLFHRNSKLALVEAILSVMPKIFFRKHQLVVQCIGTIFDILAATVQLPDEKTKSSPSSFVFSVFPNARVHQSSDENRL